MNNINSIRNAVNYYDSKKQSIPAKQGLNSIPAASIYKSSGLNALSSYNQASVSFEGLGFFKKLGDKVKAKKEEVVAKHQQKKEEKLQKKAEKLQAQTAKVETAQPQKTQAPATEPAKVEAQKPAEEPKAEEVKAAPETAETQAETPKKNPIKDIDMRYFPGTSQPKYLKMTDSETGVVTIDWYKESGSIAAVEERNPDGTETYTTFYDTEGKMPMETFITLPDGKHQYIKYRKNGTIKVVADLKEDNKTLISFSRYHYSDKTGKLDTIKTIYEDRSAIRQWFREDGSLDCEQYEKNGKVDIINWFFEDGENVRLSHKPLANGGLERCVYDKEGKLVLSDITKADKSTSEEITNYYYKEGSKKYYKTNTVYDENTKSIDTWYNENETQTCSIYSENGKQTKAIWYFEDGETPNIEELYLADGRTQKVTMDKEGRWLEFTEFPEDKSSLKVTKYIYEGKSETPHSSITTHSNGTVEKVWYDDKENMSSRRTTVNGIPTKLEWFHKDGVTPKIVRTFSPDGKYTDEVFDEKGNPVKESVSA